VLLDQRSCEGNRYIPKVKIDNAVLRTLTRNIVLTEQREKEFRNWTIRQLKTEITRS